MKKNAHLSAGTPASIALLALAWSPTATAQVPTIPSNGYAGLPAQVDLSGLAPAGLPSSDGTPRLIRDQGGRASCTVFGAIAALEIEYASAGYGALDLSEEFLTAVGSQAMVHPIFADHQAQYAALGHVDFRESKISFCSGGGGVGQLENLQYIHVPVEAATGYRSSSPDSVYCGPVESLTPEQQANFAKQSWLNTKNFAALPPTAYTNDRYYGVQTMTELDRGDAELGLTFAAVLDAGHPIVVDLPWFDFTDEFGDGVRRRTSTILGGAHAVAIVGYDRSNPSDPVLLVKNSHGEAGVLRFDYDDLVGAVIAAGFINEVVPPQAHPEYRYIGRWNVVMDGYRGVLDINGLPYFNTQSFEYWEDHRQPHRVDRRIGMFFPQGGEPRRVNGAVVDGNLTFYMTASDPNLEFDALPMSQRFTYRLVDGGLMVGTHKNSDGSAWGGYAIRDHAASPIALPAGHRTAPFNSFPSVSNTRAGLAGSYHLFTDRAYREVLRIGSSSNSSFETSHGEGRFMDSSASGRRVRIYLNATHTRYFELYRLSWQAQVLSGYEYDTRTRVRKPALLARYSSYPFYGTHSYAANEPAPEWTYDYAGDYYGFSCPGETLVRIFASDGQEHVVHSGESSWVPVRGQASFEYSCGEGYSNQRVTLRRPTNALYVYVSGSSVFTWGYQQVFPEPRHANGLRLDWCLSWGVGCGQAAADAFCASKGFGPASDIDIDVDVGATDPTYVPASNRVCDAYYCDALKDVVCQP